MVRLWKMVALAAMLAAPATSHAQDFPTSRVTIVVPSSPGAGQDIMGRFLAEALAKLWNQPVVVENRPGAGGNIGAAYTVKAKPDGYTLLITANSYNTNAATQKLPFDPIKDLMPVGMVARGSMIVVTGQRVPMPSLGDVIKQAKTQKIFYGTSGVGALPSFAAELLAANTGIKLERVVYKGAAEAMVDLGGKRLDLYIATLATLMPTIDAKQAVPVLVMSDKRISALPDVPTGVEAGFPGAKADVWYGVFAPAGTPASVLAKLNESIARVTTSPEGTEFLRKSGTDPVRMSVQEFSDLVVSEIAMWKKIAVENNMTE